MKKILVLLCFFLICTTLSAQDENYHSTFFLEAGGCGGIGSYNFDKVLIIHNKGFVSSRVGLGFSPDISGRRKFSPGFVIPTIIHCMFGKSRHYFETGFGLTLVVSVPLSLFSEFTPSIGYRFQRFDKKGIFFRVNYTPLISFFYGAQIQHWAGVSIGYTFRSKR